MVIQIISFDFVNIINMKCSCGVPCGMLPDKNSEFAHTNYTRANAAGRYNVNTMHERLEIRFIGW